MANETRPRREPSGSSRIRKATSLPSGAAASPSSSADSAGAAPLSPSQNHDAPELTAPPVSDYRDRGDRESYRDERPADREPIRFRDRDRDRDREPVRESRDRAESG